MSRNRPQTVNHFPVNSGYEHAKSIPLRGYGRDCFEDASWRNFVLSVDAARKDPNFWKLCVLTMASVLWLFAVQGARLARGFVAWILAGMSVKLSAQDVAARLAIRPVKEQILLIVTVLSLLAVFTLAFGQAGWGGVAAFWLALVYVLR